MTDMPASQLSNEAAILLNLMRTPPTHGITRDVSPCVHEMVNWSNLIQLSHLQGLLPLAYQHLHPFESKFVPQQAADNLKINYCLIALLNYYLAQELLQVLSQFRTNHIPALPYKGPILANSAYGKLALRQFSDLDVLVDESNYERAKEVLLSAGFHPQADYGWESHFLSPSGAYCLDLHQNLTPRFFPYTIRFEDLWERRSETVLCGERISCLSDEDSLLILCIQLAKDSWAKQTKLSKLRDIDKFLDRHPDLDWGRIEAEAARIGARRTLSFALALVNELLERSHPTGRFSTSRTDRRARSMAAQARNQLLADLSRQGFDFLLPVALSEQARFHSQLRERVRDKLPYHLEPLRRCCERLFIPNARDRRLIALPGRLYYLYFLIRPFRLACEYLLRPFAHALRSLLQANHEGNRPEHS